MSKSGDKGVMYCEKCEVETPHTYKSSTVGDISKKIIGKTFSDIGSGWYCDNCGKKNGPDDIKEEVDREIEDFEYEDDEYL